MDKKKDEDLLGGLDDASLCISDRCRHPDCHPKEKREKKRRGHGGQMILLQA